MVEQQVHGALCFAFRRYAAFQENETVIAEHEKAGGAKRIAIVYRHALSFTPGAAGVHQPGQHLVIMRAEHFQLIALGFPEKAYHLFRLQVAANGEPGPDRLFYIAFCVLRILPGDGFIPIFSASSIMAMTTAGSKWVEKTSATTTTD